MKFKIFRYMFISNGLMLPLAIMMALLPPITRLTGHFYTSIESVFAGIFITMFSLGAVCHVFSRRKDCFSYVTITEKGVDVTCFGRSWFKATWEEIKEIGEFNAWIGAIHVMDCIYFSKDAVVIDENIFSVIDGTPCSAKVDYRVVFLDVKPKMRAEILRYIDKERIVVSEYDYKHGFFKMKKTDKLKNTLK